MRLPEVGDVLKFLQGPVVRGTILQILHLHGHHGAREGPREALLLGVGRQQLGGERRVQRVRQQHELELHLQRGGEGHHQQSAGDHCRRAQTFRYRPWFAAKREARNNITRHLVHFVTLQYTIQHAK